LILNFKLRKNCEINFLVFVLLILVDYFTKIFIKSQYKIPNFGNPIYTIWPNFLDISYVENRGIAFGIPLNGLWFNVLVGLILLGLGVYVFGERKGEKGFVKKYGLALTLILAGGVGNLINRIQLDYVIDFINFSFWPTFNLADIAVSAGVLLLIYWLYKNKELK